MDPNPNVPYVIAEERFITAYNIIDHLTYARMKLMAVICNVESQQNICGDWNRIYESWNGDEY